MLSELRQEVYDANMEVFNRGLVIYTWGNVSGISQDRKYMVIKPSGVAYEVLSPEKMVVVSMSGEVVEGNLKPSSDTMTHLQLYKAFPEIGGICHTHSMWATIWAQAAKKIPCLGTTHADHFYGDILCTRKLTQEEVEKDYEENTGKVILEMMRNNHVSSQEVPAILVQEHGPFTWGKNPKEAVYHAAVLETIAQMAFYTRELMGQTNEHQASQYLQDKHYYRKHGKNASYGQE